MITTIDHCDGEDYGGDGGDCEDTFCQNYFKRIFESTTNGDGWPVDTAHLIQWLMIVMVVIMVLIVGIPLIIITF